MRAFKKQGVDNPLRFNGEIIKWQLVGSNTGIRELHEEHESALIAFLDGWADKRKMGIVRISAEIASELKKKAQEMTSRPPHAALPQIRAVDRDLLPQRNGQGTKSVVKPAGISQPAPIVPPSAAPEALNPPPATTTIKPKTAKRSVVAAKAAPAS